MTQTQQEDLSVVIKKLRDSKTRVQQLETQLDQEKTNGKLLYEKFMEMQGDLRDAFCIATVGRKRGTQREKTPEAALKSLVGKAIAHALKDGKKPPEAKEAALAIGLSLRKKSSACQRSRKWSCSGLIK
jgi:hypothetical protein